MSKRKTVNVSHLIELVNNRNRTSVVGSTVRMGWNSLLEAMLHETGNYKGYGYLTVSEVPAGQEPGIIHGTPNVFPDETRRVYFT